MVRMRIMYIYFVVQMPLEVPFPSKYSTQKSIVDFCDAIDVMSRMIAVQRSTISKVWYSEGVIRKPNPTDHNLTNPRPTNPNPNPKPNPTDNNPNLRNSGPSK